MSLRVSEVKNHPTPITNPSADTKSPPLLRPWREVLLLVSQPSQVTTNVWHSANTTNSDSHRLSLSIAKSFSSDPSFLTLRSFCRSTNHPSAHKDRCFRGFSMLRPGAVQPCWLKDPILPESPASTATSSSPTSDLDSQTALFLSSGSKEMGPMGKMRPSCRQHMLWCALS